MTVRGRKVAKRIVRGPMSLSIRQLQVFVTVAQLGSFAEAARVHHLTGPALSLIIKGLEESTGFRVLDRTTRSVRLTQAGKALLEQSERLLSEHRNLELSMANIRQRRAGIVRVAATQLLSCTILPPTCTRFLERWPDIEVVQVDCHFDRLQELLMRGEADLGIGPERICDAEIVATHLFSSPLNVACSVHHPFASKRSVKWTDLKDEQVILVDKGAAPLMSRDAKYQLKFESRAEVGNFTTALALANENRGVVVSASYAHKLLKPYELVLVPLEEPATLRKIMLYRSSRYSLSPAAERFADDVAPLISAIAKA